jgi:DNA-binding CsgD family transcriptional regulator
VTGEAGIGKTALLRRFREHADGSARMLWARCDPLFTPRPLGPVLELAGALGDLAARVVNGAKPFDIAAVLLRELSAEPSVLVFEDVHWADEATLDVIRLVGRRIDDIPALLVLSYRDDGLDRSHPLRTVLGDLPAGDRLIRLELPALTRRAVTELAAPAGLDGPELHRRTAGNPFFVTEVLAAGTGLVPRSVRDAVLARAARLSAAAQALLDAVAVVPGPAELWLLAAEATASAEALDECLAAGIVSLAGGRVEFRHEIARQVLEESLPPGRRAALHRAALTALARRPSPDLARLAHHAEAAGDGEAVLRFAPAAAEHAAAAGARHEAAGLYARALRFAGPLEPAGRATLLERFAQLTYFTGSGEQAVAALREAVAIHRERHDSPRLGAALRQLAIQLGKNGAVPEARVALSEAVAALEELPPGPGLARCYSSMAATTGIADDAEGARWARKAIALAERVGCLDAAADALNILGSIQLRLGNLDGLAELDRSRELARQAGDELGVARAYLHPAIALAARREWLLAERYIRPGLGFCREHGLVAWEAWLISLSAETALARGRWDEAAAIAAEIIARPADRLPLSRVSALVIAARIRARRGGDGYLDALAEAAETAKAAGAPQYALLMIAAARAEAAWLDGASARLIGAETSFTAEPGSPDVRWFAGELEVWRHRAGLFDGDPAELPEPYRLEMTGDAGGAAGWWQERGCGYDAALALACSADPAALRRAFGMFQELGARTAAAAVARRLRALGEPRVPRGPRPSTAANRAGLTSREAEVLGLLAAGLSNAQIATRLVLSSRTIDNHVAAVFRKLGVRTRGEAGARAARLGLTGTGLPGDGHPAGRQET